jgi:hypothetical protein
MLLRNLPSEETTFFKYHRTFFPRSYDIKILMRQPGPLNAKLRGGLQEVADQLQVSFFIINRLIDRFFRLIERVRNIRPAVTVC